MRKLDFIALSFAVKVNIAVAATANGSCFQAKKSAFLSTQEISNGVGLASSSTKLEIGDSRCSGSFISDDGHVLTASHCLDECAFSSNKKSKKLGDLKCSVWINGLKTTATVLMMRSCPSKEVYAYITQPMIKANTNGKLMKCSSEPDLAILLPDKKPENFGCLPLARKGPQMGGKTIVMGFPIATHRGRFDSDGRSLQFSFGEVVQTSKCKVRQHSMGVWERLLGAKYSVGQEVEIENSILKLGKNLIQTTADMQPGNSGSPVINENGEIVGVASFVSSLLNQSTDCSGAAFFEPLDSLFTPSSSEERSIQPATLKCQQKRVGEAA